MEQTPNKNEKKGIATAKSYLRHSDIAFKMGGIILLGTMGGKKLDQYFAFQRPYFTLVGCLASIFLAIYVIIKDLSKKK